MQWFRKPVQVFLQGLIIIAPIVITIWAIYSLFTFIDRILPDLLEKLAPQFAAYYYPGVGFVLAILFIFFVGYISTTFLVSRVVEIFDGLLQKTPGIKFIYTTVKDFFEAFAGDKKKFDKAVLVAIENTDIWQIGFITQTELSEFGLHEFVAVYVPQSYAFAGHLYFVKKEKIQLLKDGSAANAMKFAISGGVTTIDEPVEPVKSGVE